MAQTEKNKKFKIKKSIKVIFATILVIAAIVLIVIFGFKMQSVEISTDLNQFTSQEVKSYLDANKIDNTLIFWFRNKVGLSNKIDLFEKYTVKLNSPFKVTINAYEKKIQGYIDENGVYSYFGEDGRILKKSPELIKGITKITGLGYNKLDLYQIIEPKDKKALEELLTVTNAIEEYSFKVKTINITDKYEVTLLIKSIYVQLGKSNNLDRRLMQLNDMYSKLIKYEGTLDMKRYNQEGSYTLTKNSKSQKK